MFLELISERMSRIKIDDEERRHAPGRPDEFVKKIAQNLAQPIFPKLKHILYCGKK
jgi:hypothetical protein